MFELGQCDSLILAIRETPIKPKYHQYLLKVSLTKGAMATTAIEGNTLSLAEVENVFKGQKLPPSKEYQEIEVRNILTAMNILLKEVTIDRRGHLIDPALIQRLHKIVGKNLGDHFDAIPGRYREDQRTVGPYRCPDYRDVPELVNRLCDWLPDEFNYGSRKQSFVDAVIQAIVTHVYIEWIHPFGDGNGRTGRMLEFYILLRAGVPDISSHILSNHYNLTRPEYYRQIHLACKTRNLSQFIKYAVEGLRDGLVKTLELIQYSQFETAWEGFIYEKFAARSYNKKTVFKRRRDLMLAMPIGVSQSLDEMALLTPSLARRYAKLTERTLQRDIEVLLEMELIERRKEKYLAFSNSLKLLMARRLDREP